jgi:hypothetical protein
MAYTIAKSTGGRMAISDGTLTEYHPYSTIGKMYTDGDDIIIQLFGVGDKATSFRTIYTNITSPAGATAQLKLDAIEALLL